jgi:hypothetical protein
MAEDNKKSPEEASNLFHNIMKASVSQSQDNLRDGEIVCPQCKKNGTFIPPTENNGDGTVTSNFKCSNGHLFKKILPIK